MTDASAPGRRHRCESDRSCWRRPVLLVGGHPYCREHGADRWLSSESPVEVTGLPPGWPGPK